jgi:hypothetical protein
VGVTQRNAICSWTLLEPRPEVILLSDEEGVADATRELNVRHVARVACNEFGTPFVNSLFEEAQKAATHEIVCYVNADVILMNDFLSGIERVVKEKPEALMVGRRWNVDLKDRLDFDRDWQTSLRALVMKKGRLYPYFAIDYFVFPKNLLGEIPPLAIGRPAWDNWVIYRARMLGIPIVDMTEAVTVVHQNHDYSHHPDGWKGTMKGQEARQNIGLVGEVAHAHSLLDATHRLTPKGLKRRIPPYYRPFYLYKHLVVLSQTHQSLKPFVRFIKWTGNRLSSYP